MRKDQCDRFLGAAALGLILLAGGAANAASVTINFDVLPDGTPFPAQTTFAATAGPLREEFAADGVHFTGEGGVLAGGFGVSGFSGANMLAFNVRSVAAYANGTGPVPAPPEQISFDEPANLVEIMVGSAEPAPGTATLTAYDAQGNVVGTAQLPLSAVAAPIQVQSTDYNITSVQLALTGSRSMAASDLVFMVQDHSNVPPVTQCALEGPAGANGWFVGEVQVTLTATDADDQVVSTRYSLDNGGWQPYSAPFVISGDGTHKLQFQSLDSSGSWEDVQSESVKIDTIKPAVDLHLSCSFLRAADEDHKARHRGKEDADDLAPVVVTGSATDAESGVAGVTFEVTDQYGVCEPALTSFGQTIQLQTTVKPKARNGRWYKVTATATNNAGLSTSVTGWVRVLRHCPRLRRR